MEKRVLLAIHRLPLWVLVAVSAWCYGGSQAWLVLTQTPGGFWVMTACWFVGLPFLISAINRWGARRSRNHARV